MKKFEDFEEYKVASGLVFIVKQSDFCSKFSYSWNNTPLTIWSETIYNFLSDKLARMPIESSEKGSKSYYGASS